MPSHNTAADRNPLAKGCEGCFFLSKYFGCCNYLIYTDKRRPCPGGKDCTVKTVLGKNWRKYAPKRNTGGRSVQWDTEKGLKMWLNGRSYAEIATAMGVTPGAVLEFKKRHWEHMTPMRKQKSKQERFEWNTKKGYEMYKAGATDTEIAKAVGRSAEAVRKYRVQYWGKPNWTGQVKWDTEKGLELYRQGMSISQIARDLGVGRNAVDKYAQRHWRGER